MRLIVGLILLGLIALGGSRFIQSRVNLPTGVRRFFDSGVVFIVLGVTIGPAGLGVVDTYVLEQTGPLVVFCLGWIGFLFGTHLEWRRLRRLSTRMWTATVGEAMLTFVLVLAASAWFFARYLPAGGGDTASRWAALVTLAACAAGTAPASVFLLNDRPLFRGNLAQAIRLAASLDDLPGLIVFGLLFAFVPLGLGGGAGLALAGLWMAASVLIGVILGLLMRTLTIMADDAQVHLLVVFGLIAFGAGAAAYLHLSPIFVGAVAGVAFANTAAGKERVFAVLAASERPIYVLFLVLVGSQWSAEARYLLPLTALYLLVRAAGKTIGGFVGAASMGVRELRPRLGGLAMLGQGGLAIAMAVSYARVYDTAITPLVVTALIVGVMVNELLGPLAATVPFGPPKKRRTRS